MANDGCREVEWKGKAFPYLLHHPSGLQNESYGTARQAASGEASSTGRSRQAATGTWDGPAPKGRQNADRQPEVHSGPEPETVLLSSGHHMPLIGLGTYKIESVDTIRTALELGYRAFDCARSYQNEAMVGEGIRDFVQSGRREELFIVSKVWNTEHRPAALRASCEASIKDLGCTYLDLFLIHWPEAWLPGSDIKTGNIQPDTEVTVQQTWQAMEALVADGLVRSIGVSNHSLKQVEEILEFARIKLCANQVELHPMNAQRKLVGVSFRKGVVSIAHSPLGSHKTKDVLNHPTVIDIAKQNNKTPGQVLLKWNIQRGVAVVPKASSRERLQENFTGMFDWRLSNEHKAMLDALDQGGKRFIDYEWKNWGDVEDGGAAKPSKLLQQQA